ncbi:MAG: TIGR04086 family membrane protein [Bacilli bacterium]|nr:TIGR04086 family membrane protein [Bacilli bacterium]
MKYLKKLSLILLITFSSILILTFLITLLNYSNILNIKITNVFKIIIPLFSLALGGYLMGKKANKKGYLEGLKLGFVFVFTILIINLIFFGINLKDIIFYILLIISSVFGSMFGINNKKEK